MNMAECKCGCGNEVSREGMFYCGHATETLLNLVSKEPRFQEELKKIFDRDLIVLVRRLRKKGVPIIRFEYKGAGLGRSKRKGLKPFVIYYLEEDKVKAFQCIRERYPARTSRIWIEVAIPMLGNLVKNAGSSKRYTFIQTRWGKKRIY